MRAKEAILIQGSYVLVLSGTKKPWSLQIKIPRDLLFLWLFGALVGARELNYGVDEL